MRLIDADAIRKKYKHELSRTYLDDYAKGFQAGLNAATGEHVPTIDAVSVVRCRDCAKREICRTSNIWAVAPSDDWFCADGERKGGDK